MIQAHSRIAMVESKMGRLMRPLIDDRSIIWIVIMALVAALIFPLTKSLAGLQNGDGILPVLISTQKLTWYYWGEDRFLNFIPALARPFSNVEWNLRVQLFLRAFFSFLAPIAILYFFTQSAKFLALATVLANCLLSLTMSQLASFNLYVEENPFGTSLVLFWISFYVMRCAEKNLIYLVLSLFVGVLAYATNMALLTISFPLILLAICTGLMRRMQLLGFLLINALCVWLAYLHSQRYGDGQTPFNVLNISLFAISSGYENVAANVSWWSYLSIGLVVVIVGTIRRVPNLFSSILLMLGSVILIGVLSCSIWPQMNQFHIRYYLTFVIVIAACISYLLVCICGSLSLGGALGRILPAALLLIEVVFGLHGISSGYSELIGSPWRDRSLAVAHAVVANKVQLVAGDYWDVWPAVYESLRVAPADRGNPPAIYGATFRGHVLRRRIQHIANGEGSIRTICFLQTPEACVESSSNFLGAKLAIVPDSVAEVSVADKQMLLMNLKFLP